MKPSGRIIATAVVLLAASAGVLYPLQGSIKSLRTEVERLDVDLARDAGVHAQLMSAHNQLLEVEPDPPLAHAWIPLRPSVA